MPKKKEPEKAPEKKKREEPKFTKAHILTMNRYVERRDLLSVLLNEDSLYSHKEVEAIIDEFMKN